MATLVPLNDASALERLCEAGVEEVYMGFHDQAWNERFGTAELNRMSGFGMEANPFDFAQMLGLIGRARKLGMSAFVCFNASSYTPDQHEFIARSYLPGIAEAGARGIILSSQGLMEKARECGVSVVMSTVAGAFNARIAAYYRDCGAARIILPRDLSADEIEDIVEAVPDVEYEVFLMRNGCMFSDSHCLGCHRKGNPSLCMSLRTGSPLIMPSDRALSRQARALGGPSAGAFGEGFDGQHDNATGGPFDGAPDNPYDSALDGPLGSRFEGAVEGGGPLGGPLGGTFGDPHGGMRASALDDVLEEARETEWLLNEYYHRRTCGLCALWRFERLGIAAYKVVGRGDDVDDLVFDAGLVTRNANLARTCATEQDYHAQMELPRDLETLCGYEGLSCYYPELSRATRPFSARSR